MFRVYDKENKCWVEDNVYLTQNYDLYMLKRNLFGIEKLKLLQDGQFVYHRAIDLYDRNNKLIYEGDYLKAKVSENSIVYGLVTYAIELSAYIILCEESNEFFALGNEITKFIEVVGNVFDGYDKVAKDDKALQKSKVL